MNKKFNRKKLFSIEKKFYYTLFVFFSIIIIVIYTYKNFLKIENLLISTIENLSFDFNYTLQYYGIDGLNKIKEADIIIIIKPYMNTSIFLLPLKNISNSIFENNWVKTLKLKTDYKNKLFIEITEFTPIGIYFFNNSKYYFNSKGKIIDYADSENYNNNKLITFIGESSTINAYSFLEIIHKFKKDFHKKIIQATFIENRRWNLLLEGNLLLKLSETDKKQSIENYFKLTNNLSYNNLINVMMIDLRDTQKAVIAYK